MPSVYLHPVGLDGACWSLTGLRGVMVDYPGHGGRPVPASGILDIGAVADEVADRVEGPLDVIGLSIGVTVAEYLALRHPDRVRSLLLACGSGTASAGRPERAELTLLHGMAATVDETLERWFSRSALADPGHPGVAYARHRLLTDDPRGVAAIWAADRSLTTTDALARIDVPVTVLAGRDDRAAKLASMVALYECFPAARLEVLPGPHMLQLEQPAEFRAAVERHAAWVDRRLAR